MVVETEATTAQPAAQAYGRHFKHQVGLAACCCWTVRLGCRMRKSAPPLKAGDLVGVARQLAYDDLQPLAAGLELLRSWGLQANDQSIPERRWGYLAGTDQERIADLQATLSGPLAVPWRPGRRKTAGTPHSVESRLVTGIFRRLPALSARQSAGLDGGIPGLCQQFGGGTVLESDTGALSGTTGRPTGPILGKGWAKPHRRQSDRGVSSARQPAMLISQGRS